MIIAYKQKCNQRYCSIARQMILIELAKSFHTAIIQYFLFDGVVSIWAEEL